MFRPIRILVLFVLLGISLNAQERKLLWEENFEGDALDTSTWNFETGDGCPNLCGWGNNELQIYTDRNHKVENGFLTITVKKNKGEYTSTKINTKGKKEFQYGSIEARLKLPTAKGLWPAFWMLGGNIDKVGWPMCGEIDIVEYVGREPNNLFTTLHTQDSHGNSKNTRKDVFPGIEEGFHLYRVDWDESSISFFIDGEHFYTFAPEAKTEEIWPFDQPFYLLLNVAVGGNFGGAEVDDSKMPQEYVVDYIKIYSK